MAGEKTSADGGAKPQPTALPHNAGEASGQETLGLRAIPEQVAVITYVAKFDGAAKMIYVSPQIRRLGYTSEEWLASPQLWAELVHPDDRARVVGRLREQLKDRNPLRAEYRMRTRDGDTLWFLDEACLVEDPSTHSQFVHGVMLDITDRKRAEQIEHGRTKVLERLAKGAPLEEVLSILVQTTEAVAPEMLGSVLLLDADKNHLRHGAAPSLPDSYIEAIDGVAIGPNIGSCAAAAYTGKRVVVEDVMRHANWTDYREIAHAAGLQACWSEPIVSSSGEILGTFAMYYRHPRGPDASDLELITSGAHLAGIAIENKRAEQVLQRSHDELEKQIHSRTAELVTINKQLEAEVADRRRAEESLRESEERLRLTLDAVSSGGWDWNVATGEVFYSDRWIRSLGYAPDEVEPHVRFWEGLVHPDDMPKVQEALKAHFEGRTAFYECEHRLLMKSGAYRWNLDRGKVVSRDARGNPLRMVGADTDISKRKQAEEKLISEEQLLRKLLDIQECERQLISHELHDGLVQDAVGAQMFLEGVCARLRAQGDSVPEELAVANELLKKSVVEGRRMISELRPIVIDEQGIIEAIKYLVAEEDVAGALDVEFTYPAHLGRLDPRLEGAMFRIVQEALNNVKRHSRARKADVRLMFANEQIHLEIQDQGVGFDAALVPRDRFGLRGMYERARLFGGGATIESAPGKGTRISVDLPLVHPSSETRGGEDS